MSADLFAAQAGRVEFVNRLKRWGIEVASLSAADVRMALLAASGQMLVYARRPDGGRGVWMVADAFREAFGEDLEAKKVRRKR